jgi:protocatechuate 3,4-dioxygenase beta subunit
MNRERQDVAARQAMASGTPTYEGRPLANPEEDIFDQGLSFDLETLVDRRRMLKLIGYAGLGAGLFALVGCGPSGASGSASPTTAATTGGTAASCAVISEETAGPFPGDGSNGPDVLSQSGVVRTDIRSSLGEFSGTAQGVPLTIKLAIQDASNGCPPLAGAAVYLWHCDRDGKYSMYDNSLANENYLRGVQEADTNGQVTFTSIFPGAYSGRWPHIHFEIFESMSNATAAGQVLAVSQIALTEAACSEVYASAGYEASVSNMTRTTLKSDNVFGDDGGIYQLATMSGSVSAGYTAGLNVTV